MSEGSLAKKCRVVLTTLSVTLSFSLLVIAALFLDYETWWSFDWPFWGTNCHDPRRHVQGSIATAVFIMVGFFLHLVIVKMQNKDIVQIIATFFWVVVIICGLVPANNIIYIYPYPSGAAIAMDCPVVKKSWVTLSGCGVMLALQLSFPAFWPAFNFCYQKTVEAYRFCASAAVTAGSFCYRVTIGACKARAQRRRAGQEQRKDEIRKQIIHLEAV